MKRILPILLALLLFAGCGNKNKGEVTKIGETTQATQAVHPGTYAENSEIEQKTDGAVKLYDLEGMQIDSVAQVGDGLLLISNGESIALKVLSGTDYAVVATGTIPGKETAWQVTYNGVGYYEVNTREVVLLDSKLQELSRYQLPGDIMGDPVIAPDGGEIYYCVGQDIFAFDTELGVSRPVRSHSCINQKLIGCYMDGALLECRLQNEDEQWTTLYLSTETGEALSTDENVLSIDGYEDTYLATRQDGSILQYIYGTDGEEAKQLNVAQDYAVGATQLSGAVGYTVDDGGLQLCFYDLSSAKKTGSIYLEEVSAPKMLLADRWSGGVWMLMEDETLLHWDPGKSPTEEEKVYSSPVYSASAPDEEGLEALQERVDALNKEHGVTLRIWQTALKSTGGYELAPEYQIPALSSALDDVEAVMKEFPTKFLYKSVSNRIRICIVRSVNGDVKSAYYWYDGDPFIVLSVGVDVREEFIKAFSYVLDIHVLGNSPMVDQWSKLNPEGFTYGGDTQDEALLAGDTRAFADADAMKSVIDDRASIFYQAMQPDNEEMFTSETMQKKLLQLCKAIRDAWNLERKTESYLWEQYLTESIAYKE